MISLKDYAKKHRISYEAVRKQVAECDQELDGHITIQNRTRFLDEYAEKYITDKRKKSILVVRDDSQNDEIERLSNQVEELRTLLLESQNKLITALEDNKELMALKGKVELLLETKEKQETELDNTKKELAAMSDQLQQTEEELRSYHKTIFGLYRKK